MIGVPTEVHASVDGATPYGGLELRLRCLARSGTLRDLPSGVSGRQGWTDGQTMLTLCVLNLVGFESVSDVAKLEADPGLCALVRVHEARIFGRSRRKLARRHRKGRKRTFPSETAIKEWLYRHHDEAAARERVKGEAYVPAPSASLAPFQAAIRRLTSLGFEEAEVSEVTLDMDATIVASFKREALPTYRSAKGTHPGERGYQPLTVYVSEIGMVAKWEMRDGNVPAREGNRRVLEAAVDALPASVERLQLRSDSAGHSKQVIRYCNRPESRTDGTERLGVIGFAISAVHSEELQAAVAKVPEEDWRPLVRPKPRIRKTATNRCGRTRRWRARRSPK